MVNDNGSEGVLSEVDELKDRVRVLENTLHLLVEERHDKARDDDSSRSKWGHGPLFSECTERFCAALRGE